MTTPSNFHEFPDPKGKANGKNSRDVGDNKPSKVAEKYRPKGVPVSEPEVATLARFANYVMDRDTGEPVSADQLREEMASSTVDNTTVNAAIEEDLAATQEALALDRKIGFFGGTTSAVGQWTTLDRFYGAPAYFADGATITSETSGTLTTYADSASGSWWRSGNALLAKASASRAGVKSSSTTTHASGFTGVATVRVTDAKNDAVRIGFTSSSYMPSGYSAIWHGVTIGNCGGGITNSLRMFVAASDHSAALSGNLRNGDLISIAMQLTSNGYIVWAQGGPYEAWGAGVGSAAWIKIYTYTGGTISGNLAFAAQHGGGAPMVLTQIGTTSNFFPDERRVRTLAEDTASNRVDAHMGAVFYDSRGYLYTAWWNGTSDMDYSGSVVSLRVRTPQGLWSDTATVATSGASVQYDVGSFFEKSDGTVVMVLNRTPDAQTTFKQVYRTVSVTSAGVVTLGAETQLMASPPDFSLNYQNAIRITHGAYEGRIIIPCNHLTKWFAIYSDDGGSTWTKGSEYGSTLGGAGTEAAVVEEGSQKVLAAYVRCSSIHSIKMPRYISTDGGATWTESGTIDVPTYENRAQAVRLPSGQVAVVGNDSLTNYVRNSVTVWTIGEGGAVIGRMPIYVGAEGGMNYPAINCDGDRLAITMPVRKNIANDAPAYVFFMEQTLKEWEDNISLRDKAANAIAGLPSPSLNEFVFQNKASGSSVAMTNNTVHGIVQVSLSPGEWDLEGSVNIAYASATVTGASASIMITGMATDGTEVHSGLQLTTTSATDGIVLPRKRFQVASTTTVYLTARSLFSAGTAAGYGTLTARRIR